MIDLFDMEDILYEIIKNYPTINTTIIQARLIAQKLIIEVADFVEAQKSIACANCDEREEIYK